MVRLIPKQEDLDSNPLIGDFDEEHLFTVSVEEKKIEDGKGQFINVGAILFLLDFIFKECL